MNKTYNTYILGFCFLFIVSPSFGQLDKEKVDPVFEANAKRISIYGDSVLNAPKFESRLKFNAKLLQAVDSLISEDPLFQKDLSKIPSISCLLSEDGKLRLITWQFQNTDFFHFHYGFVQYKSKKGGLVKYNLVDTNTSNGKPMDTVLADTNWYGALYYNMISNKGRKGKMYYTLFGWDGFNRLASRKLIENLYFDKKGNIFFGDQIFHIDIPGKPNRKYYRHFLEYADDAVVTVNWSSQFELIMMDHLIPKDGGNARFKFTLVPDGSYQAFEWKKKGWRFIDKVFHQTFTEPPVPSPTEKGRIER